MFEDSSKKMKIDDEEDREALRDVDPRQPLHCATAKQEFPTVDRIKNPIALSCARRGDPDKMAANEIGP